MCMCACDISLSLQWLTALELLPFSFLFFFAGECYSSHTNIYIYKHYFCVAVLARKHSQKKKKKERGKQTTTTTKKRTLLDAPSDSLVLWQVVVPSPPKKNTILFAFLAVQHNTRALSMKKLFFCVCVDVVSYACRAFLPTFFLRFFFSLFFVVV